MTTFSDFLVCVRRNDTHTVRRVLNEGADWMQTEVRVPKHADGWEAEALYEASLRGNVEMLQVLLEKLDPSLLNVGPNLRKSPLTIAADQGHTECVRFLLGQGAIPDAPAAPGSLSAFMLAAMQGHLDCVRLLFDPVEVRRSAGNGSTALMLAARNGHDECVRFLLPHSDPLATDYRNNSALMLAAFSGNPRCIEALLPHSEVGLRTNEGLTALMQAARNGPQRPDANLAAMELLLPVCDWSATGQGDYYQDQTALSLVAATGNLKTLHAVLQHAPSTEAIEQAAFFACQAAVAKQKKDCAELLANYLSLAEAQKLLETAPRPYFEELRRQLPFRIEQEELRGLLRLPARLDPTAATLSPAGSPTLPAGAGEPATDTPKAALTKRTLRL